MREKDYITAYKVVGSNRMGVNWTMFHKRYDKKCFEGQKQWIKNHPEYFPRYTRFKEILSVPGTVGLMCFQKLCDAQDFIRENKTDSICDDPLDFKILKVGIMKSDMMDRSNIFSGSAMNPSVIRSKRSLRYSSNTRSAPTGTIFCKKLRVKS